ncbi:MAG: CBS domain-containing protein [Proteobacteria bacterium]|jgi:CBS domain-containing protein|nr:CBS domain-containing protein [Pseudomonadota bacterium]MDA0995089.1 CBS domain-containing protein [Pseudomonadota bacterium]
MTPKSALVKDYMTGKLITFHPETDVLDAIHVLVEHSIAGAPVTDDHGELVGMLSELDCMKIALYAGYHSQWGGPVSEYMTTDTETVDADMSIIDLAERFLETKFRRFPVVKDHRLVGQISRRDVLRALEQLARD